MGLHFKPEFCTLKKKFKTVKKGGAEETTDNITLQCSDTHIIHTV